MITYLDYATPIGSVRVFGLYDPESKAVFVYENNAVSQNYISYNRSWQVLPDKWVKTYQKWYDIKEQYSNKKQPKNLLIALDLFNVINNKEMILERGRGNLKIRSEKVV